MKNRDRTLKTRAADWLLHSIEEDDRLPGFWDWSIEKELMYIGWAFVIMLAAVYVVLLLFFREYLGEITCLFRVLFGVYCPVCGGSRAALYMFTGHFLKSLYYNPTVLTAAVVCVPFLGLNTLCYGTKGRVRGMRYHNLYLWGIVIVAVVNVIWKNYYLLIEGIALIP